MIKNVKEPLGIVFQADAPMISSSYLKKQVSDGDVITKNYNTLKRKYANFQEIRGRYSENPLPILRKLVGAGEIRGGDYVALNPRRNDKHRGSFRIHIATGRFYDFATGDRGGSVIDLAMFVYNCEIVEAAKHLQLLFPSLVGNSVAADIIPTKKKIDPKYIWSLSTVSQHNYLDQKKVTIGNARVNLYKGNAQLVIPLTDSCPTRAENLQIKGLQFIGEDGQKRFMGSVKGLFHLASSERIPEYQSTFNTGSKIILAEGYATARSIAESTDFFVVAGMSSCNMKNVAEKMAEQFPNAEIIIAADNDEAGRKAAAEALKAISGKVSCAAVYPSPEFNDFNDMYQAVGAEGLREFFSKLDERNEYHD